MFVVIDNVKIILATNIMATILQVCEFVGYNVLRFCFHRKLALVGSCRVCLCDVVRERKPVPACVTQLRDSMLIYFLTSVVQKLREDILMFILFNHPLDCPTCDQGGTCELQDFAFTAGTSKSRYFYVKHTVENLNRGPIVKTIMSRCIHCTRCVRFLRDVCGFAFWGTSGRGHNMEIGNYIKKFLDVEVSGNIIDLCPVGALTQKPYAFAVRPWDVLTKRTLDFTDSLGTNVLVNSRGSFIYKILPYVNDNINEEWLSDRARFIFDGLYQHRINAPLIKKDNFTAVSWDAMLITLKMWSKKQALSNRNCGILLSALHSCETFFAIKKFFTKMGVSNFYNISNQNTVNSQYLLNMPVVDFENCNFCWCVGLFLKKDLTVLNLRIRRCVLDKNMLFFYSGTCFPLNFAAYLLGAASKTLITLTEGKSLLCTSLLKMSRGLFLFNASLLNVSWVLSCFHLLKKLFIKNNKNYLLSSIYTWGNMVGQNEINFSYQNTREITEVSNLFIMGCHEMEVNSFLKTIMLKKNCFFGSKFNAIAALSTYILPTLTFFEQKGSFYNIEGYCQEAQKLFTLRGANRATWQILINICLSLNCTWNFLQFNDFYLNCRRYSPLMLLTTPRVSCFYSTTIKNIVHTICLNGSFIPFIYNFYLVDDCSRDSRIMQKCSIMLGFEYNLCEN